MKSDHILKALSALFLMILLVFIPGCCWSKCLKRGKTCTDCGVVYEPAKPKRTPRMAILEEDEEDLEIEEDEQN